VNLTASLSGAGYAPLPPTSPFALPQATPKPLISRCFEPSLDKIDHCLFCDAAKARGGLLKDFTGELFFPHYFIGKGGVRPVPTGEP
jgi:hypothetical protein